MEDGEYAGADTDFKAQETNLAKDIETDPKELQKQARWAFVSTVTHTAEKVIDSKGEKRVHPEEFKKRDRDESWEEFLRREQLVSEKDIRGQVLGLFKEVKSESKSDDESGDLKRRSLDVMNGETEEDVLQKGVTYELDIKTLVENIPHLKENWERMQDVTELENFKVKIMLTKEYLASCGGSLEDAFNKAQCQFRYYPGWVSPAEAMGSLGIRTLNEFNRSTKDPSNDMDPGMNGIMLTFERPGQGESKFRDGVAGKMKEDKFYASLTNYNMSVDGMLKLMQLDPNEDQVEVDMGHSTAGAARFFDGSWNSDKKGRVVINPVFKHSEKKNNITKYLLGYGSRVADALNAPRITDPIIQRVMKEYVGDHPSFQEMYADYYSQMDVAVASDFIYQLTQTSLSQESGTIDYSTNVIFIGESDAFVDAPKCEQAIVTAKGINSQSMIRRYDGDHHSPFTGDNDRDINARQMVTTATVDVARNLIEKHERVKRMQKYNVPFV